MAFDLFVGDDEVLPRLIRSNRRNGSISLPFL